MNVTLIPGWMTRSLLKPYRAVFPEISMIVEIQGRDIEVGIWKTRGCDRQSFAISRDEYEKMDLEGRMARLDHYIQVALGIEEMDEEELGGEDDQ